MALRGYCKINVLIFISSFKSLDREQTNRAHGNAEFKETHHRENIFLGSEKISIFSVFGCKYFNAYIKIIQIILGWRRIET